MKSVHEHIKKAVSKRKEGDLIFPSDFRGIGTQTAVKMALSRLAKEGSVRRLAHGIYYLPKVDPLFGELYPNVEDIALSIAKKEKVKIKPTGAYALHRLGLTMQVPTRLIYMTDGEDRQIRIGKMQIRFKATTPKKMALKGELSGLIISALGELNLKQMHPDMEKRIRELLDKENPRILKKDLQLAPARIHDYILQLLKKPI